MADHDQKREAEQVYGAQPQVTVREGEPVREGEGSEQPLYTKADAAAHERELRREQREREENREHHEPRYEVVRVKRETVRVNEREAARLRLQQSVDQLGREVSLQVNMQKEPLKMLGVATGVGAVLGTLVGRSFSRTKKVYVDPSLGKKDQKAFEKAQKLQRRGNTDIGGALLATVGTLAFRVLQDRVLAPKLEEIAANLTDKATSRERGPERQRRSEQRVNPSALASDWLHPENPGEVEGVIVRDFRSPEQRARLDQYGNERYGAARRAGGRPSIAELQSAEPSVVVERGAPVAQTASEGESQNAEVDLHKR